MAEMRIEQLLARGEEGKPIAAIVLLGSDSYLRNTCREKLIAAYVSEGMRDWALARFSGTDANWDAVFERAQTLPMLAPRQLVLIEQAEAWEEMDDDSLKAFKAYLNDPAPFTVLVLEAAGLDKRRTFFKILAEKALLVELRVDPEAAAELAAEMAAEMGAELDRAAAVLLADTLGGEMARIRNELEKLSLYAAGRKITSADVESLVVAAKKYSVWQLADMLAERRRADALEFLDSVLREGEQPPAVVGALAWMYRKLLEARELAAGVGGWQAGKALGMPPDRAELAIRRARMIPREQLLAGIEALAEADNRLKSGNKDDRTVMEFLVTQLTLGGEPRSA